MRQKTAMPRIAQMLLGIAAAIVAGLTITLAVLLSRASSDPHPDSLADISGWIPLAAIIVAFGIGLPVAVIVFLAVTIAVSVVPWTTLVPFLAKRPRLARVFTNVERIVHGSSGTVGIWKDDDFR